MKGKQPRRKRQRSRDANVQVVRRYAPDPKAQVAALLVVLARAPAGHEGVRKEEPKKQ